MDKLFKHPIKIFFVGGIIISICAIFLILYSWSYKPKNEIFDDLISSKVETTILGSEKNLPSESSLEKDEKDKVIITFQRDRLKAHFFNSEISRYFFSWGKQIKPSIGPWYITSSFSGLLEFKIENVFLRRNNVLEIELSVSKSLSSIFIFSLLIALAIMGLKN